jgi:hypothetical protein
VVTLPGIDSATLDKNAAAGSASTAQQICPADPSKPLQEPKALQTTHTAFSDPSIPQAQNIATGKSVTVAFFADGLDINNPDFIRPDGQQAGRWRFLLDVINPIGGQELSAPVRADQVLPAADPRHRAAEQCHQDAAARSGDERHGADARQRSGYRQRVPRCADDRASGALVAVADPRHGHRITGSLR